MFVNTTGTRSHSIKGCRLLPKGSNRVAREICKWWLVVGATFPVVYCHSRLVLHAWHGMSAYCTFLREMQVVSRLYSFFCKLIAQFVDGFGRFRLFVCLYLGGFCSLFMKRKKISGTALQMDIAWRYAAMEMHFLEFCPDEGGKIELSCHVDSAFSILLFSSFFFAVCILFEHQFPPLTRLSLVCPLLMLRFEQLKQLLHSTWRLLPKSCSYFVVQCSVLSGSQLEGS